MNPKGVFQVTLDSETKMKNDLLRIKKKLESDVGVSYPHTLLGYAKHRQPR